MEQWYALTTQEVENNSGSGLLRIYNNSISQLLESVYNTHEWEPWKFKTIPKKYWNEKKNHVKYFGWLSRKLNIVKMEDWYSITPDDIRENDVAFSRNMRPY